ncbi:MAG: DUF1015 domain-containing protein [Treponema sp.]|jgi:hypothetical protein|nr:DUF1015 domain-containing protein [Treponema sp.]
MKDFQQKIAALGLTIPEIMLPRGDLQKWAVIACDQFTQDRDYWEKVKNTAAGAPSALNLIFPEVFLSDGDMPRRIKDIHETMMRYLDRGIFVGARRGCVYLERDTPFQRGRRGLVVAVDLEQYDWTPSARPLIRSTEGTVPERLPPRMDIRRGAPLETSHVLLLIDDETESLLPPLGERAKKAPPLYQTGLMMGSGSISAWFLDTEADWAFISEKLAELARRALTRYLPGGQGVSAGDETGGAPFLFAAGDGNHSLAAAKGIWEEYKKVHSGTNGGALPDHPCRYALVEIENIYDPAITFEPIHRVIFGMDFDEALAVLAGLPGFSSREPGGREELIRLTAEPCAGNRFGIAARSAVSGGAASGNRYALVETSAGGIATAELQPLLDRHLARAAGSRALSIDYIHGAEELFRLASASGRQAVGILLPPVKKAGLFETVARSGPLPRKSFSMGEAAEKRFYLECRRLF